MATVMSTEVDDQVVEQNVNDVVNENVAEFVPLINRNDYEILTVHPFTIRRIDNHYEVREFIRSDGYVYVNLNNKKYYKHRLIAIQFIPNPNDYDEIDHKNRVRNDYHIENLHWCSSSTNQRNKTSHKGIQYEYVDTIPNNSVVVDFYNIRTERHEFEGYYYHNDKFYYDNDMNYRVLNINIAKCDSQFVMMRDTNNHSVAVTINRFKQQHDFE